VVTAHDVHLAAVGLHHPYHVFDGVLVGAGLSFLAGEIAEAAGQHTQVRRGDVAVDDEVDAITLAP
jgi:hypothetical protein